MTTFVQMKPITDCEWQAFLGAVKFQDGKRPLIGHYQHPTNEQASYTIVCGGEACEVMFEDPMGPSFGTMHEFATQSEAKKFCESLPIFARPQNYGLEQIT